MKKKSKIIAYLIITLTFFHFCAFWFKSGQNKEIRLISHKYNLKNYDSSNNMLNLFGTASLMFVRAHNDNLAEAHCINVSRKCEDGFKSDI